MERRVSRGESWPRAARKSEWLRSALAHHHCPDPGVQNEIVVLATGVDQYLQEVFHHLACTNRDDAVTAEDFTALCAVLGLTGAGKRTRTVPKKETGGDGEKELEEEEEEGEEFRDVCSRLPTQLSFKDFHSRLCGVFRVRSARRGIEDRTRRLPVTEDTELVQRQIRVRWPRIRRRKCVSFDLSREQSGPAHIHSGTIAATERDAAEVSALRELVEDLRSALQSSDARCLALEVALRRERSRSLPPPSSFTSAVSTPTSSITFLQGKLVPTQRIRGQCSGAGGGGSRLRRAPRTPRMLDVRDPLLRELRLIRSSRDGQLEEAIKFNECVEKELQWAYQEVRKLQGVESALRKENTQIRRRAEEAREALSLGLQRVRLIQEQAQTVPQLQSRITQLEAELHLYRSYCSCAFDSAHQQLHPVRTEDLSNKTDSECLQRAVEGRAASDEEDEDRQPREDGQSCLSEVKTHTSQLHSCGKGCRSQTVSPLVRPLVRPLVCPLVSPLVRPLVSPLVSQSLLLDKNLSWKRTNQEQQEESRGSEREKQTETDGDNLRLEDKHKMFLLEEKLTDALTLLLQLRNENMSRTALGKIVKDTLGVCSQSGDGQSRVVQVATALCLQLSSSDLLGDRLDNRRAAADNLLVTSSLHQSSSTSPLLISC